MSVSITLLVALAALLCGSATGTTGRSSARVEMGGIKQARYDRNGKLAAVIWAERATVDDEGMLVMEEVSATVYTDDDKKVKIEASQGKADTEGTGDAVFEGEIRLHFSDYVATTPRAIWRESDRTVTGNDEIVLEGTGSRIVGSGFTVFTSDEKVIVYHPRGNTKLEKLQGESTQNKGKPS